MSFVAVSPVQVTTELGVIRRTRLSRMTIKKQRSPSALFDTAYPVRVVVERSA